MLNQFFIYKNRLLNNIKKIKSKNHNSLICAMVKANAYGVGADFVVKTFSPYVNFFGVSSLKEAEGISSLTSKKILIVSSLEKNKNLTNRFSYTCSSLADVLFLKRLHKKFNVHLKINTGMNRYGFSSLEEFSKALSIIKNSKLVLEGVFTHFATDDSYVNVQFKRFKQFIEIIKKNQLKPIIHADNSRVSEKYNHNLDMIRVGFNLYNNNKNGFKAVITIKSKIVQVNLIKSGDLVGYDKKYISKSNIRVAVIPVGYADGFLTLYRGMMIKLKNQDCEVLNVCMDCFMLDITKTSLKKGDIVYILNKQNPLSNYSNYSKLSEYEVMCNFSHIRSDKKLISSHRKYKQQ